MNNARLEAVTHIRQRLNALRSLRKGVALGLWGDPGIGKTFTIRHVLREAGCQSFTVQATLPTCDLIQLLPRPTQLPIWAERVLERLSRGEPIEASVSVHVLGALLSALAPVIVCFENLHEAIPERLDWVRALAEIVTRTRGVGLVVTSRVLPREPFEALKLEALKREESHSLLEEELKAELPRAASDWIQARAAGNPLFTLEYFRFLARGGYAWNDGQRWHWRAPPKDVMPVTVEALIERLIDQTVTSSNVRDALEAMAILGLRAGETLLAAVSQLSLETLRDARHELERGNLLSDEEFAHPLFREVVVHNLSQERHRELARRALYALKDDPVTAAAFVEDANLEPARAREWLERAAQVSKVRGNDVQAARFLARAAAFAIDDERARLALEAAIGLRQVDLSESARLAEVSLSIQPNSKEAILLCAGLLWR